MCFGLPGVHNLPLWEALRDSDPAHRRAPRAGRRVRRRRLRARGREARRRAHDHGPGAANTLAAVGEAWASRSPVLVIATDIPSGLRRPGATAACCTRRPTRRRGPRRSRSRDTAPSSAERSWPAAAGDVPEAVAQPHRPAYLGIATDLLAAEAPEARRQPRRRCRRPTAGSGGGRPAPAASARCCGPRAAPATPGRRSRASRNAWRRGHVHLRRGGRAAPWTRAWSACPRTRSRRPAVGRS